ncbi:MULTISPECIES: FadR/GntR family transcriptional regulator [unclassified Saccharopolyspora]|uniref:FadR/GntR family transcriptional regulator n=1 Tax=unclassified Saccharopolyspora TaxID=2646250 RepID=UPI0021039F3E|nr:MULTISPECIES: GntR family transcriptional regulator [unclassified Saccharopolyspora]
MPTELELIELLGVSRNSVREAVRSLRALGIVDVRHGHGTVVGRPRCTCCRRRWRSAPSRAGTTWWGCATSSRCGS